MGEFSIYHWIIVALVLILVFGARQIPEFMRSIGEGVRLFREGVSKEETKKPSASQLPRDRK
jgi:sec-independent protein translocase protein TatA